jgi:pimeloyl-ACP methyl ester carboxylesterase
MAATTSGGSTNVLRKRFPKQFLFHPRNENDPSASSFSNGKSKMPFTPNKLSAYFSRRNKERVKEHQLLISPGENDFFVGIWSPFALLWGVIFLIVPAAYTYIGLVLLRELCNTFPDTVFGFLQYYTPLLASTITAMNQVSRWVEIWCCIEAVFYIGLKLYIRYLQNRVDPLEASLSAAPMMELHERETLWNRMMVCEQGDIVAFIQGWFFDEKIENISKYDIRDFIAWSMFEARHLEHLTPDGELRQLERFVAELEHRISLFLYGEAKEYIQIGDDSSPESTSDVFAKKPNKHFQFADETHHEEKNHFSDLYESLLKTYFDNMNVMKNSMQDFQTVQDIRNMVHDATSDFHPVQELRNLMDEAGKTIGKAEESAKARANQMYETLVPAGSDLDRRLSAMSHATYQQMVEAWNSVKNMKDRLEMARILQRQRKRIRQQLTGYRELLTQIRAMASDIPSKQLVGIMRKITECNEAMDLLENKAKTHFMQATGLAMKNIPFFLQRREPQRFANYSSDPLLGIATYPLAFHGLVYGLTEITLRKQMWNRGFERRVIGSVAYYFHPGKDFVVDDENSGSEDVYEDDKLKTPIVFIHGIGIGLLPYIPVIDALIDTGRPIMLPEIPYVSAFRPFQSPHGVLAPAVVCSTMTAMLASHGFLTATWIGHSYGTSWLSYMCKYAPRFVSALLFLDPICFCLHFPYLTKQFVYLKPDPGTLYYIVRTDVIVNWSIQRSFPWAWVALFTEQIQVPCSILLSEKDALVPVGRILHYLRNEGIPIRDFNSCDEEYFRNGKAAKEATGNDSDTPKEHEKNADGSSMMERRITCALFKGDGHGDWTERPATMNLIVKAAEILCQEAEEEG